MADVADDRLVLHRGHVLLGDDAHAAGGCHEDVALGRSLFHGQNLEAFHRGLKRADGVDLGDDDAGAEATHRVRTALAHIAEASDHGDLARDHDVGGALDAVRQALATTVEVVELALGDRVVDIDRGEDELALLGHLVQAVDARGGLFADALADLREFFSVVAVHHDGEVTTVVEKQVGKRAVGPLHRLLDTPVVLFLGLAFPGEHGDAGDRDGGSGVVLSRKDVAGRPSNLGTESGQRLDQHGGLNRHV